MLHSRTFKNGSHSMQLKSRCGTLRHYSISQLKSKPSYTSVTPKVNIMEVSIHAFCNALMLLHCILLITQVIPGDTCLCDRDSAFRAISKTALARATKTTNGCRVQNINAQTFHVTCTSHTKMCSKKRLLKALTNRQM